MIIFQASQGDGNLFLMLRSILGIVTPCFMLGLLSCQKHGNVVESRSPMILPAKAQGHIDTMDYSEFDREGIVRRLQSKIDRKEPLIAYVLVPLCDNENQGIVPVPSQLGNGEDPDRNLYWGARYGLKTYFKRHPLWQLVYATDSTKTPVLERLVFKRTFADHRVVYLIADAYRGDHMKTCVRHFLSTVANERRSPSFDKDKSRTVEPDLIGFVGHNGLMDAPADTVFAKHDLQKDVVVLACVSRPYFKDFLKYGKGFPLVTTENLLAPEAYVLEGILESWAQLNSGSEIRLAAARKYHEYQKCGVKGALTIFRTGW